MISIEITNTYKLRLCLEIFEREYNNGKVGIAQIFALNEDYKNRIPDIFEEGKKTKYNLYIFALHIQKENKSVVYYLNQQ